MAQVILKNQLLKNIEHLLLTKYCNFVSVFCKGMITLKEYDNLKRKYFSPQEA